VGQEQPLTDLLVRQAGRRQLSDFVLLPGQHRGRGVPATARGVQLRRCAGRPGPGAELLEGAVGRSQLGSGCGRGVGAAELLAVGEPDPGRIERPLPNARQAEGGLEERGRTIVAGGERRAGADHEVQAGGDSAEGSLAHRGYMDGGLLLPASTHRGLD
jgi:hypothetical protein